ncbi:Lipoprotein-releasing system ATP-binding protein LolD [Eubacterium plexicaudatum ASF492]|nr:Lipoprotein-releasing system ATP-binding protein LolD [Eubacterium plexicaudatum ASF492]
MNIVESQNVEKVYGENENQVHALHNISLKVVEGEFAAIVGTSGSGKSTLLHLIGGLDYPTKGKIFVKKKKSEICPEKTYDISQKKYWICISELQFDAGTECI